jgi:hypothetical protein
MNIVESILLTVLKVLKDFNCLVIVLMCNYIMKLVIHQECQPKFRCDIVKHCEKDWLLSTTSEYMRVKIVLEKGFT